MLAYIFWHRPYPGIPEDRYESTLREFHYELAKVLPPGFQSSAAYRISPTGWLDQRDGYEDWYFVDASWALDPLNRVAASGRMEEPHAAIAALMEKGCGGLYSLLFGEAIQAQRSRVVWLGRPRGIRYELILAELRRGLDSTTSCWRRQMVLSPAPEFALVGSLSLMPIVPPGWSHSIVQRTCVWPTPGAQKEEDYFAGV